MGYHLDYAISEKKINWKLTFLGIAYFIYRVVCMRAFIVPQGNYSCLLDSFSGFLDPTLFHISYLISLMISLSMVFSFRVKVLNAIPAIILPSVLISFTFKDIPILINPGAHGYEFGSLFWINYLALHWPVMLVGFYMLFTHRHTISKESIFLAAVVLAAWFLSLDDWINSVIDGTTYAIVALSCLTTWAVIIYKSILKNTTDVDPLIAPVLKFPKGIKFTKNAPVTDK